MSDAMKPWATSVAVALVLTFGAAVGWVANGWRMSAVLAQEREARQTDLAASAAAALADLEAGASRVKAAAENYNIERGAIASQLAQLNKDFLTYAKQQPLPTDCRPDAGRVRNLSAAVAAAKQAASRQ